MASKTISLVGSAVTIEGNEGDHYFQIAEQSASGFDTLAALARSEAPDGGLVVDIGANIGLSTIALGLSAPKARIVAFEPSPATAAFLRKNLAANALDRVEVMEAAASSEIGTLQFQGVDTFSAGSHVVGMDHLDRKAQNVSVRSTTLDECFLGSTEPLRLLKIDCEGHEPEVIFGGRRLLSRDRPLIHMEFNSWTLNGCAGHSPAAFAAALWDNFEILSVYGSPPPATPYAFLHLNLTQHGCVSDILMRPKRDLELGALTDLTLAPSLRRQLKDPGPKGSAISKLRAFAKRAGFR